MEGKKAREAGWPTSVELRQLSRGSIDQPYRIPTALAAQGDEVGGCLWIPDTILTHSAPPLRRPVPRARADPAKSSIQPASARRPRHERVTGLRSPMPTPGFSIGELQVAGSVLRLRACQRQYYRSATSAVVRRDSRQLDQTLIPDQRDSSELKLVTERRHPSCRGVGPVDNAVGEVSVLPLEHLQLRSPRYGLDSLVSIPFEGSFKLQMAPPLIREASEGGGEPASRGRAMTAGAAP